MLVGLYSTSLGKPRQADPVERTVGQDDVTLSMRFLPHTLRSKAGKPQLLGLFAVCRSPHSSSPHSGLDDAARARCVSCDLVVQQRSNK